VQSQGAAAEVLVDDALSVLPRLSRGLDVNVPVSCLSHRVRIHTQAGTLRRLRRVRVHPGTQRVRHVQDWSLPLLGL
jgi:hypothetical protein